jgi:hypothetical protein
MRNSNENTQRLAEDIKLSTYGRHPTAHPFILFFCLFYFNFIFVFVFLCYLFRLSGTSVFEFKFGGDALSHTCSSEFLQTPGQLFPCVCTLGTMCNLSLGVGETHLYTLCSVFSLALKIKKKKKFLHVHDCLEILVDLRIMI